MIIGVKVLGSFHPYLCFEDKNGEMYMDRMLFREFKPARKIKGFWGRYNPCEES